MTGRETSKEISYSDFRKKALKAFGKRHFKVKKSRELRDVYTWVKKNKWLNIGQPLTEREFGLIIKGINKAFQDQLLQGKTIKFLYGMGRLELRKKNTEIHYKDGELINKNVIDWQTTLKLWYEDEECYKKRKLVYFNNKETFKVYYNKSCANFTNRIFYQFTPVRAIKLRLKELINKGQIDAFLLQRKDGLFKYKPDDG